MKWLRRLLILAVLIVVFTVAISVEWHLGSHCEQIYRCQGGGLFP